VQRWVLPTADGHLIDDGLPTDIVPAIAAGVLAGRGALADIPHAAGVAR
jgi:hypothetical protein